MLPSPHGAHRKVIIKLKPCASAQRVIPNMKVKLAVISTLCALLPRACARKPPVTDRLYHFRQLRLRVSPLRASRNRRSRLACAEPSSKECTQCPDYSAGHVGFGLADTYGGPIHAPTLSRIANDGISYNAFHTTSICSQRAPRF